MVNQRKYREEKEDNRTPNRMGGGMEKIEDVENEEDKKKQEERKQNRVELMEGEEGMGDGCKERGGRITDRMEERRKEIGDERNE